MTQSDIIFHMLKLKNVCLSCYFSYVMLQHVVTICLSYVILYLAKKKAAIMFTKCNLYTYLPLWTKCPEHAVCSIFQCYLILGQVSNLIQALCESLPMLLYKE